MATQAHTHGVFRGIDGGGAHAHEAGAESHRHSERGYPYTQLSFVDPRQTGAAHYHGLGKDLAHAHEAGSSPHAHPTCNRCGDHFTTYGGRMGEKVCSPCHGEPAIDAHLDTFDGEA